MENEAVGVAMTGIELVSLIASIASLILAIGAIWLSIAFFKMSNEASKATTEAAKGIDSSIQRLENLFDKLYSDTFTMMKDTVTDMRKHIWSGDDSGENGQEAKNDILEEADRKAEEKVLEIKKTMDKKLESILAQQRASDGEVVGLRNEIEKLLDSAIQTSRLVESEAREETVRQHILLELKKLRRMKRSFVADDIVETLSEHIPNRKIVEEIKRMKEDGVIYFEGKHLRPESEIRLLTIKERNELSQS
tara:strand:+ start:2115 stop:2864 length:750 start_codon:yes stop_codon:yes gene_type:complete